MNSNYITLAIFGFLYLFFPVLFILVVVGGFLPLLAILSLVLSGNIGMVIVVMIYHVIYVPLLYFVAKWVSVSMRNLSPSVQYCVLMIMLIGLFSMSFADIYAMGHSNSAKVQNLWQFLATKPWVI